jgi:hypothetical protein
MNPEFRRYVWLELTPLRLWSLPLVVIALVVMTNAFGQPHVPYGINWDGIRTLGLALYTIFTVWAGHKAAQSVTSEVVASTWDLQRLAQHRPWELLFGKLFGSTIFEWLGIWSGLLLFAFGSAIKTTGGPIALDVLTLSLASLWLQSLALFASLAAAAGLRATRRPSHGARQSGSLIALLLLTLWLGPGLFQALSAGGEGNRLVQWWWAMPASVFASLSLAMFIFWTLLGTHRLVRAELQEPVSPAPWIGCMAFLTVYFFPFVPPAVIAKLQSPLTAFLAVAAVVCGVLFYPLLLGERKDIVRVRGIAAAWSRGDARAVWTRLPLWIFNLVGYVLSVAALGVCGLFWQSNETWIVFGVAASFGFFMLRDIGWILAVHLSPSPSRRPDLVVIFFLAVLYGLVPLLLASLGKAAFQLEYLFVPGMPVIQAADESAGNVLFPFLWALPGCLVAWVFASPRLWRAIEPARTTK